MEANSTHEMLYLFAGVSGGMARAAGRQGCRSGRDDGPRHPCASRVYHFDATCLAYFAAGNRYPEGLWEEVLTALRKVERAAGTTFGDRRKPLLLSVRSGARVSMRHDGHRAQYRPQRQHGARVDADC